MFLSEKDAQMCIYHVSWLSNYGFCCETDEECARELAGEYNLLTSYISKYCFCGSLLSF